jgi:hypothetical protein
MKFSLLFTFLISIFSLSMAQNQIVFKEDFSNPNKSYFTLSDIQNFKSTIEDGHFVYHNMGTSWRYSSAGVAFSKDLDFIYEVKNFLHTM